MDDLDFVKRCVRPDKLAWEEFLQKYGRLIYSYINSIIRIKGRSIDESLTEDIFNEIIASLIQNNFKKLKTYQGKNNATLASWLRQVTINFSLSYLRNDKDPHISLDEPVGEETLFGEMIPYRGVSVKDDILEKEKAEALTDCIQRLELDEKFFLELTLKWGLSLEELKDFLRISRGAVDMRRKRMIERLRNCFKEKGFL
jgi:RNA polymerase sigma factor (sigma-70 family)